MRTTRRPDSFKVVGRCWSCRGPVRAFEAVRVPDPAVHLIGRLARRLAHRGDCEDKVRALLQGGR